MQPINKNSRYTRKQVERENDRKYRYDRLSLISNTANSLVRIILFVLNKWWS